MQLTNVNGMSIIAVKSALMCCVTGDTLILSWSLTAGRQQTFLCCVGDCSQFVPPMTHHHKSIFLGFIIAKKITKIVFGLLAQLASPTSKSSLVKDSPLKKRPISLEFWFHLFRHKWTKKKKNLTQNKITYFTVFVAFLKLL